MDLKREQIRKINLYYKCLYNFISLYFFHNSIIDYIEKNELSLLYYWK